MWLHIATFAIMLVWSYCQNQVSKKIVYRQGWKILPWSFAAGILDRAERFIVIIPAALAQDYSLAIPSLLGDVAGDLLAGRKQKRKKKSTPVNI